MKEFLESHGFELKQYPDGMFWVWKSNVKGIPSYEQTVLQSSENFDHFSAYIDGWVYDGYSPEDFISLVINVHKTLFDS